MAIIASALARIKSDLPAILGNASAEQKNGTGPIPFGPSFAPARGCGAMSYLRF